MSTQVLNQVGLNRVAALVLADINYIAVGTGTTAASIAHTTLVTETNRIAITKNIRDANVIQSRGFFLNSQMPSPNVEEIGWFMNASATPDSGSLLCRTADQFVKGTADLLVILEVTVQEDVTG